MFEFEIEYTTSSHSTTARTQFFLNYGINPRTVQAKLIVPLKNSSIQELLANITKSSTLAYENIVKKNAQMTMYENTKKSNTTLMSLMSVTVHENP